jgi:hypothetical protein
MIFAFAERKEGCEVAFTAWIEYGDIQALARVLGEIGVVGGRDRRIRGALNEYIGEESSNPISYDAQNEMLLGKALTAGHLLPRMSQDLDT